ncbi:MAG: hypothetical protein R3F35_24690 [Myxococcota bacterium]
MTRRPESRSGRPSRCAPRASSRRGPRRGALPVLAAWGSLLAAARADALTIDFDSFASGTIVASIDGVGFSSNVPGYPLIVTSGFDTTSGSRYLGIGDGGMEQFLPGDAVTLTLPTPVQSLSVAFVSTPATAGGVFGIQTPSLRVSSGATPDLVLDDGSEVFLVTLTSATAFTSADLTSDSAGLFAYTIDDIAAPEPGLHALAAGAVLIGALGRTHGRRKAYRL